MQRLTETQVEKLIELVKQNPSLYDKHQRQNESLDLIWERIAVDLNADASLTRGYPIYTKFLSSGLYRTHNLFY
ncbi:unnamed protein product [Hermetia illucens]|uniref:MADF domain-containing protein n=1 Tax=Hermetia illucens TaxID=343691 RepID=A0A7R8UWH6_HERIL|nr:unnamed protein product [Hermetia illucens]